MISDPKLRWILIQTLAIENGNSERKKVIRYLNLRSAHIDELIRNTADSGSHAHGDMWIEVISKNFTKNQKGRHFNCSKPSRLKCDNRQSVPRKKNIFLEVIHTEGPSLLEYAEYEWGKG